MLSGQRFKAADIGPQPPLRVLSSRVVMFAVRDAQAGDLDAMAWLLSEPCGLMFDVMNLDHQNAGTFVHESLAGWGRGVDDALEALRDGKFEAAPKCKPKKEKRSRPYKREYKPHVGVNLYARREHIKAMLREQPEMTNQWIAEKAGSTRQTVHKYRKLLESAGEIPKRCP